MARFNSMNFWLEVKIFLHDTLHKSKLICKNFVAKKILDWHPKIDIDDGLKETIQYFKQQLK